MLRRRWQALGASLLTSSPDDRRRTPLQTFADTSRASPECQRVQHHGKAMGRQSPSLAYSMRYSAASAEVAAIAAVTPPARPTPDAP
jgi:hypothetical protein